MSNIIIGHLVGDYLLQSDWMAKNKKNKGLKGLMVCIIHCLIWSLCVFVAFPNKTIITFVLIFLSHFILDRTNLVRAYYTKLNNTNNIPTWLLIVGDNTLHLLMLSMIYKLF